MLNLSDSRVSEFGLLINAVLMFSIFYMAGALKAMHRNKMVEPQKDSTDE
jgi:hypothetical protein